ncbi:MAG: hypothetical protein DDT32_01898 [Syntrophomonadaceae bacterium]|nr:hypothetical protein [Bacillota bacterium]MBT9148128.1 hypothetical protein [Bacillota bacterium]
MTSISFLVIAFQPSMLATIYRSRQGDSAWGFSYTLTLSGLATCLVLLSNLKLQDPQLFWGYPIAQLENLYLHHPPVGVKIKHNTSCTSSDSTIADSSKRKYSVSFSLSTLSLISASAITYRRKAAQFTWVERAGSPPYRETVLRVWESP